MSSQASPGTEPPLELARQRGGRPMRCPRCGHAFETMRRWSLACPACGNGWQERSRRNLVDVLLDYREHAVFGLMCAAMLLFVGVFLIIVGEMLLALPLSSALIMFAVIAAVVLAWLLVARLRLSSPELEEYRRLQRERGERDEG